MDLYGKLFQYFRYALRKQYPRAEDHIIDRVAHREAKAEIETYDAQEDFERTWKHIVRTAQ